MLSCHRAGADQCGDRGVGGGAGGEGGGAEERLVLAYRENNSA